MSEDGSLSDVALFALVATRTYPTEQAKRDLFFAASMVRVLLRIKTELKDENVEIPRDCLNLILNAPPIDKIVANAHAYAANSWIAGEMILFMINAAIHHPELDVTLTKAVWIIPRLFEGKETWQGRPFSISQRTVWGAWSRFKSVAHFHAVEQIWRQDKNRETGPDDEGFLKLQTERLLEYLALSEVIRRAAVDRRIISHNDTWWSPESLHLPSINLGLPPLPETALRELAAYRPEFSSEGENA